MRKPKSISKLLRKPETPIPIPQPRPLETYGCHIQGKSQLFYDRWGFAWRIPITQGAPIRKDLFWLVADVLAPKYFEKHDWTHRVVDTLCEHTWVSCAGCSGSAKTHNIVGWACTWWLCAPEESSVILCSTTSKALRKRGWSNVQMFYAGIPGPRIGNMIDSRMMWQIEHGDDKHAITGIAVEEGDTARVADNIKGIHTMRQMVIIDEATAVPAAIFDACSNLYTYPVDSGGEFILVMIGNPRRRLDEFGKFSEPVNGWTSVCIDDEEWETTPKLDGQNGLCIRFDAEKSPNIVNPLPDGRLISKHLPTKERVEARRRRPGFENDPTYWSNERGFWSPEGISKSVFSEPALIASDAYGRHRFTGNRFRIIGALDPARTGGDRPVLRFAALGEMDDGNMGIEMMPPILIPLDATSTNPIDFQVMEQVRRACDNVNYRGTSMQCKPDDLGVDSTGAGASLVDIMQRTWSPGVMRVNFGESPSTDPVSHEDVRPANEVYNRRRAEMYFRARHAVDSRQLKGWDAETAKEICSIEFDDSKKLMGLISKDDYRKHFGKSPDLSDTVAIIVEVARRKGFKLAVRGKTIEVVESFDRLVKTTQEVHASADYSEPEEELSYEDILETV